MEKKPLVVSTFSRHIALYAKGNYTKTGNVINDLKVLIGVISHTDEMYVTINDVYELVMEAFLELSVFETTKVNIFWKELYKKHNMLTSRMEISFKEFIEYLLGYIASTKVQDGSGIIIELGSRDNNISQALKKNSGLQNTD